MIPPTNLRLLCMFTAAALLAGRGVPVEPGSSTILSSAHNLSVSGPGDIRAESEADVCGFCHTTHRGGMTGPMWNRFDAPGAYIPYTSSTSKASPGQPTGASKLCLSCHDGTVALGMLRHRPGRNDDRAGRPALLSMSRGVSHIPAGPSMLGKDLSDDHPISFPYDAALAQRNGELRDPSTLHKDVKLDANGELQCTSCHHPHNNTYGDFLVMGNTRGALCLECHDPDYWSSSVHSMDTSTWSGKGRDPWPGSDYGTVRDNACANCHRTHSAGTPQRLLTFADEEQTCLVCHNGNVARHDLEREVRKRSAHNVFARANIHDPAENVADSPPHVECVDCHNPHAVQPSSGGGTGLSGTLTGVPGVSADGAVVQAIQQESELCYRCHGDFPHTSAPRIPRHEQELSIRAKFITANASFHPVESAGRNDEVPSLIQGLTEASLITCTSCHNNDQGPGAGGTGPGGPHGSIYPPILERRLELRDGRKESAQTYAMCYKCHDRESLLANESFAGHAQHVVDGRIACTTCHDPHGVQGAVHLINFNLDEVQPLDGRMEYDSSGESPTCTLRCHDVDHAALGYDASGMALPALLPLPEATP